MEILIIVLIVLIVYEVIRAIKNKKTQNVYKTKQQTIQPFDETEEHEIEKNIENMPYKKKLLLTKNEWLFYKNLKPIADMLGYTVMAKIRVADLVEVTSKNRSEWQTYFNKINKKHVDFALAKPENLQIVLLIELDDNSHNEEQKERDEFVDALYDQTGYKFMRTRGIGDLKTRIQNILSENKVIKKDQIRIPNTEIENSRFSHKIEDANSVLKPPTIIK